MKEKGTKMKIAEKLAVLCFDEVYISNKVEVEKRDQKVFGPHNTCQFIIARGLFSSWKQPIFYQFDRPMNKQILDDAIKSLHNIGYEVICITNDMGPTNMALWSELGIGFDKNCFFINPADNTKKIFVFADVPHLMKLIRNNYIDSRFIANGKHVNKGILEQLLKSNEGGTKVAFKLTQQHLDVKGFERQKVKLATQLFSHTNAMAIKYCGSIGLINGNWIETSAVFELINKWFDLLNSSTKMNGHNSTFAYGIGLEEQNKILNDMTELMQEMRVTN